MSDEIQAIPKTMEKFFGCSGEMVKPSLESVETLMKKVPKGKIVTLDQLRNRIAQKFKVQAACPVATTKMLKEMSLQASDVSYWRVVKKKGELISKLTGSVEGHAKLLEKDGLIINYSKKTPVVKNYESFVVDVT